MARNVRDKQKIALLMQEESLAMQEKAEAEKLETQISKRVLVEDVIESRVNTKIACEKAAVAKVA